MKQKYKKTFIFLLAAVFIVNIGYSFFYKIKPLVDARAYDNIGWNISRGIGYLEEETNVGKPEEDNAIGRVGPGFEFFLAGIYKIFGHKIEIVWVLHALLRVLSVIFIYLICIELFDNEGEKTGLLAGGLFGFSPDLVLLQAMLLTETLGIFLLVISVYFSIVLFKDNKSYIKILSLSFFLTLAILTRPTSALLLIIIFAILFSQKEFKKAALIWIFPILIISPWAIRNYQIYEHFIPTSSTGGYDLWVGNNSLATGGFEKSPEIVEARANLHITELDKLGFNKYFSFISERPFKFLELQFRKTATYFSLIRPTGFWFFLRGKPLDTALTISMSSLWMFILLVGGMAGGIYMFLTRKDLIARIFLSFSVLQPLAVIPVIVESRYRTPFLPFLCVLSAVSFFLLIKSERKRILNILGWALIFLVFLTSVDIIYNADEFISRMHELL